MSDSVSLVDKPAPTAKVLRPTGAERPIRHIRKVLGPDGVVRTRISRQLILAALANSAPGKKSE